MKYSLLILTFYFSTVCSAQHASGNDTVYIQSNLQVNNQNKNPILEINSDTLYFTKDATLFNGILVQQLFVDVDSDTHVLAYHTYCQYQNGLAGKCTTYVRYYPRTYLDENGIEKKFNIIEILVEVEYFAFGKKKEENQRITFYESGQVQGIQNTSQKNGKEYREFISYKESGDTMVCGAYLDNKMHGEWHNFDYNIAGTEFVEVWDNGKLIDIKNTDVIFIGEKNKVIDKKTFLKIIKNYPNWMIVPLSAKHKPLASGYLFIMFPDYLDFDPYSETDIMKIIEQIN